MAVQITKHGSTHTVYQYISLVTYRDSMYELMLYDGWLTTSSYGSGMCQIKLWKSILLHAPEVYASLCSELCLYTSPLKLTCCSASPLGVRVGNGLSSVSGAHLSLFGKKRLSLGVQSLLCCLTIQLHTLSQQTTHIYITQCIKSTIVNK